VAVDQPVSIQLPPGAYDPQSVHALVSADAAGISAQVEPAVGEDGTLDNAAFQLLATIPATDRADGERRFRLETVAHGAASQPFSFDRTKRTITLRESADGTGAGRPVWRYNFGTIVDPLVPQSDGRGSRSCYLHPVWGMHGEVLSDDFPKDHFHHHGIFWTWPYVRVGGQTYDLWMSTHIRQQFRKWLAVKTGPVAAVLGVENGWMVDERQVATERVWVTTYRSSKEWRAFDIRLVIVAADQPVTLQGRQQKSYGGLTFRFDVLPRKDATVRVPGRTLGLGAPNAGNPDLLNTPLPWADLTTQIPDAPQRSGAAVFVHPQHPDFPPTWLTRTYGALCVGWPGVQSYTIPAGQAITLRYRVWVHAQELPPEALQHQYDAYSRMNKSP
jgi:hypothetical protein